MNIIHVIANPVGGGAEFIVRALNEGFYGYKVRSSIIYLWNPKNDKLKDNEYCLDVKSLKDFSIPLKLRNLIKSLSVGYKRKTIVHSHLTQALYYVPLATAGLGFGRIFTEHSTHNWRRDKRYLKPLERFVYRKYDRVACISPGVLEALSVWLGWLECQRLILVRNGARQFNGVERGFSDQLSMVSIGSLNTHKGFDVSIDSISHVRSIVSKYTIVGEGPERQNLEDLIQRQGVTNLVRLAGWSDNIEDVLQDADLMIVPSRREGFGLVAIEGLSAGLPVICSDVAGLRDVVEDCGAAFLFPSGDVEGLAEMIRRVRNNMLLGKSFLQAAKSHAAKYGVQAMINEYYRVYVDVLADRYIAKSRVRADDR